ncbi:Tetratricopeptide TPR_1 repeat-containing protein [Thioalkalivibrio nitratireducens DSM 14787]|uniref:Tetratricopeptide TPR_1 repeat-containing protein n=1 Tax=Thioalkalivibrio nitratireducens (strain DSM 14787 / UNIQEM 213 / ALEN2) TaxID=1255043 RepID=L0DVC7_THIND|nr:tetratricopeptide repeat protein [Thioalkalivibrio nitratireducens]AGA32978.1 Tetratricopeptide TPR_1 repeat-containing protein [Thioalkalivibrio nitratireducens DSM 14787]
MIGFRTAALAGAALMLVAAIAPVHSDLLQSPPPAHGALVPVPAPDLSGAEPRARIEIEEMRDALRDALADPQTRPVDLAERYGRLGALYHVHEVPAGAVAAYHNARTLDPDRFRWAYLDAWLAHGSGRLKDALAAYEDAAAIDPDYAALPLRLGEVLLELNRPDDARDYLQQALAEPGLEAAAAFRLGQLALQHREFESAVEWFQRALEKAPDADAVYTPLAQALRGVGAVDASREALALRGERHPLAEDRIVHELDDLDTGARRHFLLGLQAARERRYADAAAYFAQGLGEAPDNHHARISYARALYLSGQPARAREMLEAVLQDHPQDTLASFLLGVLLDADGDGDTARGLYEQVLALHPEHPGAAHHLGLLAFRAGDWPTAARLLSRAGERFPDNSLARVLALVADRRAGRSEAEIQAQLETVIQALPQHPLPRYALSRLLSAAGDPAVRDPARGLELAEGLLRAGPIPPVFEALALARAATGDPDGALSALDRAETGYRQSTAMLDLPRIGIQRQRIRDETLPGSAWPEDDPVLAPPPTDPRGVLQEYPSPRPF